MDRIKRIGASLREYYGTLAVIFLNCVIVFVVINLIADAVHVFQISREKQRSANATPWAYRSFNESLTAVHPGLTEEQISKLIVETRKVHEAYESYTQFKEKPYGSEFVNVTPHGFRAGKGQKPWPPSTGEFTVFVFGGSTTFGYGVGDDLTIPSHIQNLLDSDFGVSASVYNFGRGSYFSVQERVLFEKLLLAGFVPDMAIFIDGLNDFCRLDGQPARTRTLTKFFDEGDVPLIRKVIKELPIVKALAGSSPQGDDNPGVLRNAFTTASPDDQARVLHGVVERYQANMRITEAICKDFGVTPIFVWQPMAIYKYHRDFCIFGKFDYDGQLPAVRPGYELMAKTIAAKSTSPNFIWAADMQQDLKGPMYVDAIHYSGEMSRLVAAYILRTIKEGGLMQRFQR